MNVWDEKAEWWQERFTAGADDEYERQMLPLVAEHVAGAVRVLDVGTGEGQVARCVKATGADVTGIDTSEQMLARAREIGGDIEYRQADATDLPFGDASFDAVTACLVLEHVDDYVKAISEVARVLRKGGRFLLFLNHPAFQTPGSGWIDDHILEEQYWRSGPYLREQTTDEEVDAGVVIPFAHRPLSAYVNAMAERGLLVTRLVEPAPEVVEQYPDAATIPRLLFLRAELVGDAS